MNNPIIETIWLKLQAVKGPPITDRRKSKHLFHERMVIAIKKAVILVNSHFTRWEHFDYRI